MPHVKDERQKKMNQQQSNKPVHVIRYGSIRAAIWSNRTDSGQMYNVTVSRSYKDGEEWKDSGSFGPEDCLVVSKAMTDAHTWIYEQKARDQEQQQEGQQR